MANTPDPGGHFASDTHRRVLGHLSTPTDRYGWTLPALENRLKGDDAEIAGDDLQKVLTNLKDDGLAENPGGSWRQTEDGFKSLNAEVPDELAHANPGAAVITAASPIGDEPVDEAPVQQRPAMIVPSGATPTPAATEVSDG